MAHHLTGVVYIDIGQVGIVLAEAEEVLATQVVEPVAAELGMEEPEQLEGVKAAMAGQVAAGQITAQVVAQYLIIVLYIMAHQHAAIGISDKLAQGLLMG